MKRMNRNNTLTVPGRAPLGTCWETSTFHPRARRGRFTNPQSRQARAVFWGQPMRAKKNTLWQTKLSYHELTTMTLKS